MKYIKSSTSLLLISIFVFGSFRTTENNTLQGLVSDKSTGQPLPDIYLYTIKGEEEALTNKRGEFKIVTWQKLPVVLHVRDPKNGYFQVKITSASEKIHIKL